MYAKSIAALSLLVLGARAAPAKRDDAGITLPGVGVLTIPGIAPGETIAAEEALSILQADSQAIATAVPVLTSAIAQAKAGFVYSQALTKIPATATQVSVFIAEVSGTPIVEVSSIGGAGVTLATGGAVVANFTTEFAGQVFTAVPESRTNHAVTDLRVPRALVVGVLTIVGSIAVGAMAVL
ncbi:hypothetical protein GY45DRAFT_1340121 [Cubamyces sp. BRFM 1775]|nr:hypothetical protein GY45DRAFT_1340121 [Cubamyces sp. BRFM 1775]